MKVKLNKKLSELPATAISGNDISSSVLYVSALSIIYAGQYAWVTLLIVAFVLFLFRKIYAEVVGALPLNGGAYNALLNTTSKNTASFAAALTILSYMATSVISANEAMHYLHTIIPDIEVISATIVVLLFFAGLTIIGIKESSLVAIVIFLFHLTSIVILSGAILYFLFQNGFGQFGENWHMPVEGGSIGVAIFLGFSVSMLGISGFESSANFVEEQERGVFPKTLRNMWIIVSVLNPLMAFFALSIVPIPEVRELYGNTLLSHMGDVSGGSWLAFIVSVDAVLVLSGAVLTSYVGVSGLLERMTLDRILPPFFLKKNKRGSSTRIILMFLILNISVLFITNGRVAILAGVYTISFLSVMALFAIGNIFLKIRRAKLPRPEIAPWYSLIIALAAVFIALVGNIKMEPEEDQLSNFSIFMDYFVPTILLIIIMLNRISVLRAIIKVVHYMVDPITRNVRKLDMSIIKLIQKINSQEFVFFTKGDHIDNLNKVMLYILRNEQTRKVKIVTVMKEGEKPPVTLKADLNFLNRLYPEMTIDYVIVEGNFGPELIQELANKWGILPNFMFIGVPGNKFPYHIEELGGVRLII
ncbi:MAG: APC family permease [Bacteroidales bacterium]|nr:APC family permease [Bacteroidales bacterium]